MKTKPDWLDYAIYDDDGLCGIRDDAPDELKKSYNEYKEEEQRYIDNNLEIPR